MPVVVETIEWGGWPNCRRISNGEVELIVTADIGPRIMRYGFIGGPNLFKVFEDQLGKSGEPDWQMRGGHRVWLAPEDATRTYAPDNGPVQIETDRGIVTATQPVEPTTGLRKQLIIRLADTGSRVEVVHRMRNTSLFAIEISAWTVTMMAPGGTAITGFPPRASHADALAPTNPLVMWAFTNLTDPRWTFLEKYLVLRHDPANAAHTKLGLFNKDTWGAYLLGSNLFLKWCAADPTQRYPDFGCSCELFARDAMLEVETLSPLMNVEPGAWIEHTEQWSLHRDVAIPESTGSEWTDDALDRVFSGLLERRAPLAAV
jgi:hypothetical protein